MTTITNADFTHIQRVDQAANKLHAWLELHRHSEDVAEVNLWFAVWQKAMDLDDQVFEYWCNTKEKE